MNIPEKYIELMLLDIDNEISEGQKKQLNQYLNNNISAQNEYDLLKETVLQVNELEYPNKSKLYEIANTSNLKFWQAKSFLRVAAVLIPLVGFMIYYNSKNNTQINNANNVVVAVGETTQNINENIELEDTQIQNQQNSVTSSVMKSEVQDKNKNNIVKPLIVEQKSSVTLKAIEAQKSEETPVVNKNVETIITEEKEPVKEYIVENIIPKKVESIVTEENTVANTSTTNIADVQVKTLPINNVNNSDKFTTYDLGLVDIKISENDSNTRVANIRKGLRLLKAAKEIATNGLDVDIKL